MSVSAINASIEKRFLEFNQCPVVLDNLRGDDAPEFIRPTVIGPVIEDADIGSTLKLYTGFITCQVFTEKHKGSKRAYDLADNLISFIGDRISDVVIEDTTVQRGGIEDKYYSLVVRFEFYFYG